MNNMGGEAFFSWTFNDEREIFPFSTKHKKREGISMEQQWK